MKTSRFFLFVTLIVLPTTLFKSNAQNNMAKIIAEETDKQTLEISIAGLKNNNGKILIALYNNEDGFNKPEKVFKEYYVDIVSIPLKITLNNLPSGTYAFALFHDENNNRILDKNLIGIPKEGFTFSNNALGSFGPPPFDKAKFTISASKPTTQALKLKFY